MTANVQLPENQYNTQEKQVAFYRAVNEKLAAIPWSFFCWHWSKRRRLADMILPPLFPSKPAPSGPGDPGPHSMLNWVAPEYFETLHIPLQEGRFFTVPGPAGHAAGGGD